MSARTSGGRSLARGQLTRRTLYPKILNPSPSPSQTPLFAQHFQDHKLLGEAKSRWDRQEKEEARVARVAAQREKEVFEFRRGNADLKAEVEMFVKAHPAWATNIAASPEPAIIPQRGSRNMGYVKHRLIIEAAKQTIMKKDRDSKAGLIAMQRIAEAISNAWIGTFYKAWVHIVTETKTDEHEALRFFLSRRASPTWCPWPEAAAICTRFPRSIWRGCHLSNINFPR